MVYNASKDDQQACWSCAMSEVKPWMQGIVRGMGWTVSFQCLRERSIRASVRNPMFSSVAVGYGKIVGISEFCSGAGSINFRWTERKHQSHSETVRVGNFWLLDSRAYFHYSLACHVHVPIVRSSLMAVHGAAWQTVGGSNVESDT